MSRVLDVAARAGPLTSFALTGMGIVLCAFYLVQLTLGYGLPVDVHAYWAADPNNLYVPSATTLHQDAYLYSPAFELLVGWGRHFSFEAFSAIWRALLLAVLVFLAGPLTIPALLLMPGVASEINAGNIQMLLAAAIVLSFRRGVAWAGLWAFVLLTKVTPGVGLLWFAARREWRALVVALGVTAAIAVVTFAIWPDRWLDWIRLLTAGGEPEPLAPYFLPFWPRLVAAVVVVLFGAWRGWPWLVVVGATLALPAFYLVSPSLLVGVLPFVREAVGKRFAERLRAQASPAIDGIVSG